MIEHIASNTNNLLCLLFLKKAGSECATSVSLDKRIGLTPEVPLYQQLIHLRNKQTWNFLSVQKCRVTVSIVFNSVVVC